jgi:hypothetical protein
LDQPESGLELHGRPDSRRYLTLRVTQYHDASAGLTEIQAEGFAPEPGCLVMTAYALAELAGARRRLTHRRR